jgi:hypothetical protein
MLQGLLYRVLADSSEAEGLNYVSSQPPALELMLTPFVLVSRPDAKGGDITPIEFLYNSIVERKAAVSRVMQQRRRFLAITTDAEVRSLGLKLQETRQELAKLLILRGQPGEGGLKAVPNGIGKGVDIGHTPETPLEAGRGAIYDLVREKERIEREIAERMPPSERILQRRNWAAELRRALPPCTALVEFFYYRDCDPSLVRADLERPASYLAFVIRPDAPPELIKPGFQPFPYDSLLREWRQELLGTPRNLLGDHGSFWEPLWKPIEEHLGPSTAIYIAPDGQLTRFPWAALLGRGNNRILLEDYALAIMPHGQFLLEQLTRPIGPDQAADRLLGVPMRANNQSASSGKLFGRSRTAPKPTTSSGSLCTRTGFVIQITRAGLGKRQPNRWS